MNQPDPDRAIAWASERLRRDLPAHLHYHGAGHTLDDVLPAARRLAGLAGLDEADSRLLEVAAAFHDLGHVRCYEGHEDASIALLAEALPACGYDAASIRRLSALIDATRMPQTPLNREQQLLADADLDSLGRPDFLVTSTALWREQCARGHVSTWPQWLAQQRGFVSRHRYFSPEARALRDAGKADNLRLLERLIGEAGG